MTYTIYRTTSYKGGGIDGPAGSVESFSALAALEEFARNEVADYDYSIDQSPGRVVLCPYGMQFVFYTYTDAD